VDIITGEISTGLKRNKLVFEQLRSKLDGIREEDVEEVVQWYKGEILLKDYGLLMELGSILLIHGGFI
jgi:hypothetical protein